MNRVALSFIAATVILVVSADRSYGIPAFARKYKTSCATCHNGYPKLTAFGDAFRRNGYQFPAGTDPEFIKEEPVSLGSEGNKKAFPDAIWPGSIPGSSPVSLFLNGEMDYNPKVDPRFTFGGLGSSIEAVAAGTVGEDLSFWGQFILNSDGTAELNRIFLVFSNLVGDSYGLNMRVGVFEPGLFSFSTHRAWMEGFWLTTRPFSDDMGWTIEETQKGIELNGIIKGRFTWSAGIVESFGSPHADKDYYGHVAYKFGGLPPDGVVGAGAAPNNAQPFIDNSLTIGAFAYAGSATLGPDPITADDRFTMVGGDFNASYERFNLFGGIGVRHDDQPFVGTTGLAANTTVWFAELDYVVFPWLLPGIRYESWSSQTPDVGSTGNSVVSYSEQQVVPGIVFLVRPNVKATLRASFAGKSSINYTGEVVPEVSLQPGTVSFSLTLGI
jgi:hypothetical protein